MPVPTARTKLGFYPRTTFGNVTRLTWARLFFTRKKTKSNTTGYYQRYLDVNPACRYYVVMLNEINNTTSAKIETVVCGRCGGTGKYSYCQTYGHTCFKCGGAGAVMTKRGAEANRLYIRLLSKPTVELKAGDQIRYNDFFTGTKWRTVTDIYLQTAERNGGAYSTKDGVPVYSGYVIECDTIRLHSTADELHRVAATKEQKQAAKAKALIYQDRLTKAGKVAKKHTTEISTLVDGLSFALAV